MPKLARLRFISIGHPNARMQDLTLNLSDQSGMPTDSTIWLRNGGGKSSILSLFFALPRPNRRDFLGSRADAKQRRIEDYILTNDRSVVAAEWVLDETAGMLSEDENEPQRFVTGVFYEYAGGNRDSLRRLFFCARVRSDVPETQLSSLPVDMKTVTGETVRRTMLSFKQAWHALRDAHPNLQCFTTDNQSEWSAKLQSIGIDPGLFGYQLIMNSREGGADELFRFNNPEDFVDFLLELTVDPSSADNITENLQTFRKQLQRRKHELLPDLTLSDGLVERLAPLSELHDRRLRTAEEAQRLARLNQQIQASIALGMQAFLDEINAKHTQIEALRMQFKETESRQLKNRGMAIAVSMRLAQRDADAARRAVEDLTEQVERAQHDQILWKAAPIYRDYVIALKDVETFREQLASSKDNREPLLEQVAIAAKNYVAAMRHQIQKLSLDRDDIRKKCSELEKEASALDWDAVKYERAAAAYSSEADGYEKNLRARENKFEALLKLEILQDGETPQIALERIENAQKGRRARLRTLERNREGNAALQDECSRQISDLQNTVAEKKASLKALDDAYQKACHARDQLEADKQLLSLLELDALNIDELSDDHAAMLTRRAAAFQERTAGLRTQVASLERARVHIAESGLMPPSLEVETLLTFLGNDIGAQSGWRFICDQVNATDREKELLVKRCPALAQGIIVPDEKFDAVKQRLAANPEIIPPLPVVIATPNAFQNIDTFAETNLFVAGPKDHAWFNTDDAKRTLENLEKQIDDIQQDIRQNENAREQCHAASNKLKLFRSQFPRGYFASSLARLSQLRIALEDEQARLEMQIDEKQRLVNAQRNDERETTKLNNEIMGQDAACARLREFVDEVDAAVESWKASAAEKHAQSNEQQALAEEIRQNARQLRQNARDLMESVSPIASGISVLENDIAHTKYAPEHVEPVRGAIEELKNDYNRILSRVEREFSMNDVVRLLDESEKTAKKALKNVKNIINGYLSVEAVKDAYDALDNPNDMEAYASKADELWRVLSNKKDDAIKHQSFCEATLANRKNAWFGAGKPELPEDVLIQTASVQNFERKANENADELKQIDADIRNLEKQIDAANHARDNLSKDLERLNSVRRSHAQTLKKQDECSELEALRPDEIENAISELEQRLEKYKTEHESLDSSRNTLVANVRKWAQDERFEHLQNRILVQFKQIPPDELENVAAEYRDQLKLRIQELSATLDEIEKHRTILAKFLLSAAEEGLRLIKLADSASIVPRNVPDIGGSRFLRITTKEPAAQADKLELIQELVDILIDETNLPTGTKLIQRAVRHIAHPFSVRVLNPDPASPQRLIEITETARFSGGEQLTCAILLYCTLANVRARSFGLNRQPTSVLILDNPIGRASRTVFINMQRQFAGAMGIQLIYTTAVNDLEALSILPNIVRLRNERTDINRGHRLLEQEPDISGKLEAIRLAKTESSPNSADSAE